MSDVRLETPARADDLYRARGGDVEKLRPIFTGDVFCIDGEMQCVIENPCSLRIDGVNLKSTVLMAPIERVEGVRSDWANQSFRTMPLPDLLEDGETYVARLDAVVSIPSNMLRDDDRVATLTQFGINLLSQRFLHHVARVIVPTHTLDVAIVAEYEEADLAATWCEELDGVVASPLEDFHEWIRAPWGDDPKVSRQRALRDPQQRSTIRRQLVAELRTRRAAA